MDPLAIRHISDPDEILLTPAEAIEAYRRVRLASEQICTPLETDDYMLQSIVQTSPPKWHLAHVSWFFETFLLSVFLPGYRPCNPAFGYLFNSYYEQVGAFHPRPQRGLLSRPSVAEIYRYRAWVDEGMVELIERVSDSDWRDVALRIAIGLNHEQQHQELLLTDIKHNFSVNPLFPSYRDDLPFSESQAGPLQWLEFSGGLCSVGAAATGFAYDNERPRHRVYLRPYRLASRPVTNGEFLVFMADKGYERPELWLSDGWSWVQQTGCRAPLYWHLQEGEWHLFTLAGMRSLNRHEPVAHLGFYEADAYARWAGARLPTEQEWELAAADQPVRGNLRESGRLHPVAENTSGLQQMFGDVWEWTASPYVAYPGYRAPAGALGEYNGKFMCNQMVLRGGSCVTPTDHLRASYRNFFYPDERWQFSGLRLAQEVS